MTAALLKEALALLDTASEEYKKRSDAGNARGQEALNAAVLIWQNELTETEQATFEERRNVVQQEANEAEDAAAFDPDWDHSEEPDEDIEDLEATQPIEPNDSENETDEDRAEMYSSLSIEAEDDGETPDENSEED